jgi:hypothetical protein
MRLNDTQQVCAVITSRAWYGDLAGSAVVARTTGATRWTLLLFSGYIEMVCAVLDHSQILGSCRSITALNNAYTISYIETTIKATVSATRVAFFCTSQQLRQRLPELGKVLVVRDHCLCPLEQYRSVYFAFELSSTISASPSWRNRRGPELTSRSRTSTPSSRIPLANCTSSSYKISAVPVWMYTFVPASLR